MEAAADPVYKELTLVQIFNLQLSEFQHLAPNIWKPTLVTLAKFKQGNPARMLVSFYTLVYNCLPSLSFYCR